MDHNDSLRNYFKYKVPVSEIEVSGYCICFAEILNDYNFYRVYSPFGAACHLNTMPTIILPEKK